MTEYVKLIDNTSTIITRLVYIHRYIRESRKKTEETTWIVVQTQRPTVSFHLTLNASKSSSLRLRLKEENADHVKKKESYSLINLSLIPFLLLHYTYIWIWTIF